MHATYRPCVQVCRGHRMRVLLHDGGGGSDRDPARELWAIAPRDTAAGVQEMGRC
jgi:hypothetical protein